MQNNLVSLYKDCFLNDKLLKPYNNVVINYDFLTAVKNKGLHDAAYDSLTTGVSCVCMANMLAGYRHQIQLDQLFAHLLNKYHSFGQEVHLTDLNQKNLLDNEKYVHNTLYGETTNDQALKQYLADLQKKHTFERTQIQGSFFLTFDQPVDLEELSVHQPGFVVVPYAKRRRFG